MKLTFCVLCGTTDHLEHHHVDPSGGDERENMITVCSEHHGRITGGHNMAVDAKHVKTLQHWQLNPIAWIVDKFPGITFTTQQKEYWVELGKLIRAKFKAHTCPGKMTDEEREYAGLIGISIMAGQGTSKDFDAAMTILFFIDVFPYSKTTATGLTGKHLRNILWAECSKIIRLAKKCNPSDPMSETVLEAAVTWQTERIFHKGAKNPGAEWFAEAVTINPNATEDDQAKTLYGRHEDFQLIVIDEAASVPEPVFGPLEGTLTSPCSIALMIFNPTRNKGYAWASHYGPHAHQWLKLRRNAEECERVTPEHLAKMAKYGRESNPYRVKVLGLPPLLSGGGAIPYEKIMAAVNREFDVSEFDPVIMGVDPAAGGDKSVVTVKQGPMVRQFKKQTADPDDLADWVSSLYHEHEAAVAFVDVIGIGWALPKALQNRDCNARKADARNTAKDEEKHVNKRTEMYWDMCQDFINDCISIEDDEDLINCLGAIKFKEVGKRQAMPLKKEMKKDLDGFSPDESDSLALTYAKPASLFRKGPGKKAGKGVDFTKVYLR